MMTEMLSNDMIGLLTKDMVQNNIHDDNQNNGTE